MKTRLLQTVFAVIAVATTGAGMALAADAVVPVKASVDGKYADLLKVIHVPGDEEVYGKFNDWGFYRGTSWKGHDNLPPGYWVYVGPNWYIWKNVADKAENAGPPIPAKAHVNGKYSNLLKVIKVEKDEQSYGKFYDWGYWNGTSWADYTNLPPGYWVYVTPNWYIWKTKSPD